MTRPDSERIKRNTQTVFGGAGETATIRAYVSGTTGAGRFGVSNTFNYTEVVVTALFASNLFGAPRPSERNLAGGQAQNAELMMTTDTIIHAQSEIVWRGTAYRIAGAAMPQVIGGRILWRNPLTLASVTG